MNRIFILISLALLSYFNLTAQTEEATTKSGKKVILYQDGTWKYAGETVKDAGEPVKDPVKVKKPVTTPPGIPADCEALLETYDDTRSGLRITRTLNMLILSETGSNQQIGISMEKNSKGIILLKLRPVGAGDCIGDGNKVNIVFTDGSKTELAHDGFPNCNGESVISFGGSYGKKKQLEQLKTKKIKSIKVWTQQGSVQEILSNDNQQKLARTFNCFTL